MLTVIDWGGSLIKHMPFSSPLTIFLSATSTLSHWPKSLLRADNHKAGKWGSLHSPLQMEILPATGSTSVLSLSRVETLKKLAKLMGAQAKGIRYFPRRWQKDSAWSFSFSTFSLLWRKMGKDRWNKHQHQVNRLRDNNNNTDRVSGVGGVDAATARQQESNSSD